MSAAAPPTAAAPARETAGTDDRRRAWLLVGLFAAVSGALRAAAMPGAPLWYDETFSLRIISPGATGSLWTRLQDTESTPPLFYALSWLVRTLGIDGVASIRLVSVAAAALVVVAAFWAAGKYFGPRVALGVAAIVAVHPMISAYAIDGRSYELLLLIAFGLTGVLGMALVRPAPWTLVAWAALATLACWTHYFALFLVVAGFVLLFVLRPAARRAIVIAAAVWVVTCVPLLDLVLHQGNDSRAGFIGDRSLTSRVAMAGRELLGGNPNISNIVEGLALLLAASGVALALAAAVRRRGRAAPDGPPLGLAPELILAIIAAVPIGLPLLVSIASEHYDRFFGRNVIVALPAIAMLVAAGLVRRQAVALVALLALCGLMAVGSYAALFDWRYGQPDVQGALKEAGPSIRTVPILTNEPRQVVLPFLLQRTLAPAGTVLKTDRLDVLLSPVRNGTREFTALPIPPQLAQLQGLGFAITSDTLFHGVRRIVLQAPAPVTIPSGIAPPLALFLPAPVTDPPLQRSLLGDAWG